MLANRVGDACFLIGLFLLIQFAGTVSFQGLNGALESLRTATLGGWSVPLLVCLLFLVGATGKSAQIPLYVWLPDAMAGPTPVSALIHAATMVTAGVYLTARLHGLYALAPEALSAVAVVGAATALFAATIAVTQTDIKKVLAYSTVSQLGYMFLGVGVGLPGAAVLHLVTHAFFKGLLFLCAGSVIHAMGGEQDMRKMGGLRGKIPVTFATMLIGTLAIAGVPPLSGFWSKDEIIWGAFAGPHPHPVLGVIGYVAAGLTAFYMGRLLFLTFFGRVSGRPPHAGAPARVAAGDDGAPDGARGALGDRGLDRRPPHRRAGDGPRAPGACATGSARAGGGTGAGRARAGLARLPGPAGRPWAHRRWTRGASTAWCATSIASTSSTTR